MIEWSGLSEVGGSFISRPVQWHLSAASSVFSGIYLLPVLPQGCLMLSRLTDHTERERICCSIERKPYRDHTVAKLCYAAATDQRGRGRLTKRWKCVQERGGEGGWRRGRGYVFFLFSLIPCLQFWGVGSNKG